MGTTAGKVVEVATYLCDLGKIPRISDVLAGLKTKLGDLHDLGTSHSDVPHAHTPDTAPHSDPVGPHADATHPGTAPHDGRPHEYYGTDGHRHYDGDPQHTWRDNNGRLRDSTTNEFTKHPRTHDGIDQHARRSTQPPGQRRERRCEYRTELAGRTAAHIDTADLTARNAAIQRLEHDHGIKVDSRDLTSDAKIFKTIRHLNNEAGSPAARAEIAQLRDLSRAEVRSLSELKTSSEHLGMLAGRDVVTADGGQVIVGHAGQAAGAGRLDTIGLSGDGHTLRIAENKGGSSSLGSRMAGDERVQQGTTTYLNDLLHRDPRFLDYLHEHPQFAQQLADGQVHVQYELVRALPGGGVKVQVFTTNAHGLHLHDLHPSGVGAGR